MCGHDVFQRGLGLLSFEGMAWMTLSNMFLYLGSHARPKELVMHEVKHVFQHLDDQPHHGIPLE